MITEQLRDTRKKLAHFTRDNNLLRTQLAEKKSMLKRDQLGGKTLECKLMEMSISNDGLKDEISKLQDKSSKVNHVKTKLTDLLHYVKGYTVVGDIRFKIKSLFVEGLERSEELTNNQDEDDDIVWESL